MFAIARDTWDAKVKVTDCGSVANRAELDSLVFGTKPVYVYRGSAASVEELPTDGNTYTDIRSVGENYYTWTGKKWRLIRSFTSKSGQAEDEWLAERKREIVAMQLEIVVVGDCYYYTTERGNERRFAFNGEKFVETELPKDGANGNDGSVLTVDVHHENDVVCESYVDSIDKTVVKKSGAKMALKSVVRDPKDSASKGTDGTDIIIGFATVDGKEAIAQVVEAILKTQRGELQLDTDRGIPYFETVFTSRRYAPLWASYMEDAIRGCEYVKSLDNFTYAPNGETMNYRADFTTVNGETESVNG